MGLRALAAHGGEEPGPSTSKALGAGGGREGFQEERGSLKRKKAEREEGRRERSPGWQG